MVLLRKFAGAGGFLFVGFLVLVEAAVPIFVVFTGLVGTGTFPFVGPLPFARFAHVLPQ
jgi:hypothetical protein